MKNTDTVWISVAILVRSKFDDGWQVEGEDKTKAWIGDERIIDSEEELQPGISTKIELSVSYAESKGLA
jgi:hypothetical protein